MDQTEQEARRRAEAASKALTDRVLGPPRPGPDPVGVSLDWTPAVIDGHVVFHVGITRGGIQNSHDCEIDLARLATPQLKYLRDFLGLRHAGITSAVDVTKEVAWLLDIWLGQTQPELSKSDRDRKVRELLLAR
jgi:hypothetical protein